VNDGFDLFAGLELLAPGTIERKAQKHSDYHR